MKNFFIHVQCMYMYIHPAACSVYKSCHSVHSIHVSYKRVQSINCSRNWQSYICNKWKWFLFMTTYDLNLFIDYTNLCAICNMRNNYSIYKTGRKYIYETTCLIKKKKKEIKYVMNMTLCSYKM